MVLTQVRAGEPVARIAADFGLIKALTEAKRRIR